ncbi:hypothetical protein [Micromonospora harpali]|uniref:Tat (Twin-arginine translocation) pathway signal sequence n=1 Tax=Micromonospora harpali TaxID=1490225 RepID=A0ABW1HNF9_9ACTN
MTDRSIPAGDRQGLSRRGFLGGVGASAADLTVAGLLGDARPASAAYYMKWGAVVSPGDASNNIDFSRKVDILRRMRPQTARISMFWGDPYNRRFSDAQLDSLRGTGLTEMIIQSSEDPDPNLARHQLSLMLPYIDAHPNTLFVWELGNEPDWHQPTNPWLARWNRLATIRDNKPSQDRGNLLWAVNMPAGRWAGDGTGFTGSSGGYFDSFVRDTGDGLGGMLSGPYQPDVVTVHCYSSTYLKRGADGGGERNPYKMIDYVRGWNNRISMKVTEAGIDGAKSDRGYRYVSFGSSVANETAGQIDSVCFYGIPPAERQYGIGEGEADQIGTHP